MYESVAYPLMWTHIRINGEPPWKVDPLPDHYKGEKYWESFHKEESWYDDSNTFEDPFEDPFDSFDDSFEDQEFNPIKRSRSHEILGVDPDADRSEIKRAYREKILETHPDKVGGDGQEFIKVKQAYECLIS